MHIGGVACVKIITYPVTNLEITRGGRELFLTFVGNGNNRVSQRE